MQENIDVAGFLEQRRDELIASAEARVRRAHLAHYEAAGNEVARGRLAALLDVVVTSCRTHHMERALNYADSLATDRHAGGYELIEVQTVINVLEEEIWRSVMTHIAAEQQGYALALVSTVLGAVKDSLARGYVTQLGSHPVPLHVESLFGGSEGTGRTL